MEIISNPIFFISGIFTLEIEEFSINFFLILQIVGTESFIFFASSSIVKFGYFERPNIIVFSFFVKL